MVQWVCAHLCSGAGFNWTALCLNLTALEEGGAKESSFAAGLVQLRVVHWWSLVSCLGNWNRRFAPLAPVAACGISAGHYSASTLPAQHIMLWQARPTQQIPAQFDAWRTKNTNNNTANNNTWSQSHIGIKSAKRKQGYTHAIKTPQISITLLTFNPNDVHTVQYFIFILIRFCFFFVCFLILAVLITRFVLSLLFSLGAFLLGLFVFLPVIETLLCFKYTVSRIFARPSRIVFGQSLSAFLFNTIHYMLLTALPVHPSSQSWVVVWFEVWWVCQLRTSSSIGGRRISTPGFLLDTSVASASSIYSPSPIFFCWNWAQLLLFVI